MTTADDLFPHETRTEDGQEIGFNREVLCRAVELWFHAHTAFHADRNATIGEAALAFNVTPDFLAKVIDEAENPYFFAHDGSDVCQRVLDSDGF